MVSLRSVAGHFGQGRGRGRRGERRKERSRHSDKRAFLIHEGVRTVTKTVTRAGEGIERTSVLVVREDGGQHEKFKHDPHAPKDALRDLPCV